MNMKKIKEYFGYGEASPESEWRGVEVTMDFANVTREKKLLSMSAKISIVWAWNSYEFDGEDLADVTKAAAEKRSIRIMVPEYMVIGDFRWRLDYRHKTKELPDIEWPDYLKLSNRERDDYVPIVRYKTLSESTEGSEPKEIKKNTVLEGDRAQKFADVFYELIRLLLGIKLDPTIKDSVKEVPDPKKAEGIELADITVSDGSGWVLLGGINIPAEVLENLTPESQTLLVRSLDRLSLFFARASKSVSNKALKTEKDTGPKKTVLDFTKEAAWKYEKENSDCKKGYAKDVEKTIDQLVASGYEPEDIMYLLKSSGNHDKILEMAKKLQEEAKKAKPEGDGGSKSGDGDDGGTKVPSEIKLQISWYERAEKNSKDVKEVAKKLPYDWDREFGKNPTYNEARSSGALKGLPFIELTVFELCLRFLRAGQEVPTDIANFAEEQYKIAEEALKHS